MPLASRHSRLGMSDVPDSDIVKFLEHKKNINFGRHWEVIHCHSRLNFTSLCECLSDVRAHLDILAGMFRIHANFVGVHCLTWR